MYTMNQLDHTKVISKINKLRDVLLKVNPKEIFKRGMTT